jgi:hypothetical protein
MSGQITKLPDLATSFQKMKIIDRLAKESDHNTMVGAVIINACLTKQPANEILQMIKDQAGDNSVLMASVIGEDLMNQILEIEL